jgi:hypothetical protein
MRRPPLVNSAAFVPALSQIGSRYGTRRSLAGSVDDPKPQRGDLVPYKSFAGAIAIPMLAIIANPIVFLAGPRVAGLTSNG